MYEKWYLDSRKFPNATPRLSAVPIYWALTLTLMFEVLSTYGLCVLKERKFDVALANGISCVFKQTLVMSFLLAFQVNERKHCIF